MKHNSKSTVHRFFFFEVAQEELRAMYTGFCSLYTGCPALNENQMKHYMS